MQTTRTIDINRFKNAVGFTATFKAWGNRRKADLNKVSTDADKRRLSLSKELIQAEEYDAIKRYMGELRQWIYSRTVPSFFKEGFQLASLEAVETIEQKMKQATEKDLPPLVSALQLVYASKIDESRAALGDQFNAADYPTEEQLPQLFSIGWNWIAFTTPEALPPELRKAEEEKLQKQFADAGEQITEALRVAFSELITHATERLTTAPGEKPKVFRDSLIGNIQEFLDTFNSRNLMNDTELAAMVDKARAVMVGVEPEKLRKYSDTRKQVTEKLQEIKSAVDGMIETKKSRQFDFSE